VIHGIDLTAVEKLKSFLEGLKSQGIELAVAPVRHPLEQSTIGYELDALFPDESVFENVEDAVAAFASRVKEQELPDSEI
jgi:hypothetical protein